jgi:fatty acyl-CoA reductase
MWRTSSGVESGSCAQIAMDGDTDSPVQQLFRGAGVLVTGGTGFLGNLLLEKLLRTCLGVKTVFLLIRPKKEKTEAKRFAQIFDGPVSSST